MSRGSQRASVLHLPGGIAIICEKNSSTASAIIVDFVALYATL